MAQPHRIDLRRLGTIGARGMVIHAGKRAGGSYAFFADNNRESWRNSPVSDIRQFAQEYGFNVEDLDRLLANSVATAVMKTRTGVKAQTVFVNLNGFHDLADPSPDDQAFGTSGRDHASKGDLPPHFGVLLIHENDRYYFLTADKFHLLDGPD